MLSNSFFHAYRKHIACIKPKGDIEQYRRAHQEDFTGATWFLEELFINPESKKASARILYNKERLEKVMHFLAWMEGLEESNGEEVEESREFRKLCESIDNLIQRTHPKPVWAQLDIKHFNKNDVSNLLTYTHIVYADDKISGKSFVKVLNTLEYSRSYYSNNPQEVFSSLSHNIEIIRLKARHTEPFQVKHFFSFLSKRVHITELDFPYTIPQLFIQ